MNRSTALAAGGPPEGAGGSTALASGAAPAPAAPAEPPPQSPPAARVRRWHRAAIPFLVLVLVVGTTLVARHLTEPDLSDPDTLAPHATGPDGSSRLAELLAGDGVAIDHVTDDRGAVAAVGSSSSATLFLPNPNPIGAGVVWQAIGASQVRRVVLVAPSAEDLAIAGLPVDAGRTRWAARAVAPGCEVPEAVAAGTATALQHRYQAAAGSCYRGGLVRVRVDGTEVFVVGATDPFRNGRIDEHGNAALARGLLGGADRVVWAAALAQAPPEPLPPPPPGNPVPGDPPTRPGSGPGGGDPPDGRRDPPPDQQAVQDRDRSGGGLSQLLAGYPLWLQVALGLLVLLGLLVALARARRLGPPVGEPLPVLVPAAETVAGSGRLYRFARGRGATITTFREAAQRHLLRALNLPAAPPPDPAVVVEAVARRTGVPPDEVHRVLYGPPPETDAALAEAVAALDALVAAATRDRRPPPAGEEPH